MTKKERRRVAILLSILMIVTVLPVNAQSNGVYSGTKDKFNMYKGEENYVEENTNVTDKGEFAEDEVTDEGLFEEDSEIVNGEQSDEDLDIPKEEWEEDNLPEDNLPEVTLPEEVLEELLQEQLIKADPEYEDYYESMSPSFAQLELIFPKKLFAREQFDNQVVKNPQMKIVEEDESLQIRKSIIQKAKNNFDITLEVLTKQKATQLKQTGMDVILVIDISGSMEEKINGQSIISTVKESAKDFAKIILEANPENRVGIVSYDHNVTNEISYAINGMGMGSYVRDKDSFTKDMTVVDKAIDGISTFRGETYIQGGIRMARDIFANAQGENEQKVLVFTDGMANKLMGMPYNVTAMPEGDIKPYGRVNHTFIPYRITSFDESNKYMGESPSGGITGIPIDGGQTAWEITPTIMVNLSAVAAISEAVMGKDDNIEFFSIFFEHPSFYNQGDLGLEQKDKAGFTMKNIANDDRFYETYDLDVLEELFKGVAEELAFETSPLKIVDPMGEGIFFEGIAPDSLGNVPKGAFFQIDDESEPQKGTLKWNLATGFVPEEIKEGNMVVGYRYAITYNISLDETLFPSEDKTPKPTNKTTTITYKIGQSENPEEKIEEFEVPLVQGGLYEETKIENVMIIRPTNIIAYQGGNSHSGDSFPRPHFYVEVDKDGDTFDESYTWADIKEEYEFFVDKALYNPSIHDYYVYDFPFRGLYINQTTNEVVNNPLGTRVEREDVGFYTIRLRTAEIGGKNHEITAKEKATGKEYKVEINNLLDDGKSATLEIRKVTDDNTFVTGFEKVKTEEPRNLVQYAQAIVPKDTIWKNSAGFNVEPNPSIALMHDKIFEAKVDKILREQASLRKETSDMKYETVYLDLVNTNNGNIVLKALNSQGDPQEITIYYPYPTGTDKAYDFKIIHFKDVDRGVGRFDNEEYDYEHQELLIPERTDIGLKFKVTSFSPFVIAYKEPVKETHRPSVGNSESSKPKPKEKMPELNKIDHNAYLTGYPDYDFRADDNMTRAEVAVMFSNLLLDTIYDKEENKPDFRDIKGDEWYANKVGYIVELGIMNGYPDGSFRPDEPITRAEFATVASKFDELKQEAKINYWDLSEDHWARSYIALAVNRGWIGGYPDASIKADSNITRAEVATVVNNMLERYADKTYVDTKEKTYLNDASGVRRFTDLDSNHWAYYNIMEAVNAHDYTKIDKSETWLNLKLPK